MLFGNTSIDDPFLFQDLINIAFYPIFGNMAIFDKYHSSSYFDKTYSKEACLNGTNLNVNNCPNKTGVILTFIILIFYLILMNLLFVNLLISSFG